jgi:hypothetical protein
MSCGILLGERTRPTKARGTGVGQEQAVARPKVLSVLCSGSRTTNQVGLESGPVRWMGAPVLRRFAEMDKSPGWIRANVVECPT